MSAAAEAVHAVVRDVRWTDLAAMTRLEAEVFPDDAWSERSWWAELAGRPRREYVLAAASAGPGAPVLGYGGVDHGGEVCDLMTLVVAPAARGTGLGRVLLAELEARALARGARHVMLEVRADNGAALGLYAAAGYQVLSTRRGYYQPGAVDALVMRRTLGEKDPRKEQTDG